MTQTRDQIPAGRKPAQEVLLLGSAELAEAITLGDVVDAVERGYRAAGEDRATESPRVKLAHPLSHTFLNTMPAMSEDAGAAGVHIYTGGNRGLPLLQKITLLFSMQTGALEAVIESDWLSWARTGATSAVSSRHLARPDATALGIIGTGKQAQSQLLAIAASRPFTTITCYSRDAARCRAFAREMSERVGREVVALDSAEDVVERSDIVCTATTSSQPVFDGAAIHPGLHVNAIGAHRPNGRELDARTMLASRLFADDLARCAQEDGAFLLLPEADRDACLARTTSLSAVVAGTAPGRRSADEITAFHSGGLSSEYLWTAVAILDQARAKGLGTRVSLG
jgi:alanine dehydrogenase